MEKRKWTTWTPEEDKILTEAVKKVKKLGKDNWLIIAKIVRTKTNRQCRERWTQYLDPNINKSPWTPEEDENIVKYKAQYGSKWSLIAKCLGTRRSGSYVKNRWHTYLVKNIYRNCMDNTIFEKGKESTPQPSQSWVYIPLQIQQTQQLQKNYTQMPQPLQFTQPTYPQTTTTQETTTQAANQLSLLHSANRESDNTFKPFLPQKGVDRFKE